MFVVQKYTKGFKSGVQCKVLKDLWGSGLFPTPRPPTALSQRCHDGALRSEMVKLHKPRCCWRTRNVGLEGTTRIVWSNRGRKGKEEVGVSVP